MLQVVHAGEEAVPAGMDVVVEGHVAAVQQCL